MSELGNVWPVLKLYHVESKGITSQHVEDEDVVGGVIGKIRDALFGTLNFFTAPVIEFGNFYTDEPSAGNEI